MVSQHTHTHIFTCIYIYHNHNAWKLKPFVNGLAILLTFELTMKAIEAEIAAQIKAIQQRVDLAVGVTPQRLRVRPHFLNHPYTNHL